LRHFIGNIDDNLLFNPCPDIAICALENKRNKQKERNKI